MVTINKYKHHKQQKSSDKKSKPHTQHYRNFGGGCLGAACWGWPALWARKMKKKKNWK